MFDLLLGIFVDLSVISLIIVIPIYLIMWGIRKRKIAEASFLKAYNAATPEQKSLYLIKYAWGDFRVLPEHKNL